MTPLSYAILWAPTLVLNDRATHHSEGSPVILLSRLIFLKIPLQHDVLWKQSFINAAGMLINVDVISSHLKF